MYIELLCSSSHREAVTGTDPETIAENILSAVTFALDCTAPQRRIQIKKKKIEYLSTETETLQNECDLYKEIAHETSLPEDWHFFCLTRNRACQSLK